MKNYLSELSHTYLRGFTQKQDGAVILIFGLALALLMTSIGVGIDMARYNIARSKMQHALDLAILSAAAVKDAQDIEYVTNNFFLANYPADTYGTRFTTGMPNAPVEITYNPDTGIITGTVEGKLSTIFGKFVGLEELTINRFAEVAEDAGNTGHTEIVLTLDISASMCKIGTIEDPSCRKLQSMKAASTGFINKVYADDPENLYVGIVPFTHNVRTKGNQKHPLFGPSVWVDYFKPYHLSSYTYVIPPITQALTNSKNNLLNYISALTAEFKSNTYTRTNVGSLAGSLMLMPYSEDKAYFDHEAGLPNDFGPATQKVLVLMTDGENVPYFVRLGAPSYYYPMYWNSPTPVYFYSDADNEHQANICTKMKETYGVTIFTVVFDMADGPIKEVFRNCATNSQFFFDAASGEELVLAYDRIAESIQRIRLNR